MIGGEIFLSAFFKILFHQLARLPHRDFWSLAHREGLEKKLEKLERLLLTIKAVLVDAEHRQLINEAVKLWLHNLRDLAYDAEDVLDEISYEALRQNLMETTSSKFKRVLQAPIAISFRHKMGSNIDQIIGRLEDICHESKLLGLNEVNGGADVWQTLPTTSLPDQDFYGRDEDRKNIINLLLRDNDMDLSVVPIVGMGGLGKTTLAQQVYNDPALVDFQPKAWVCVSVDFDVLRITKAILEAITKQACDLKELDPIQSKLRDALARKKFLIVLDDVWNTRHQLWDALKRPFMVGAKGSKVIVTTRSTEVAKMMGHVECYELQALSGENCWTIFEKRAVGNQGVPAHSNLELLREKFVDKCGGLPLAARTLGGLLRSKPVEEWDPVLNSKVWSISDKDSEIYPVLRLSYQHLPSELKRCFAYCSIFPQDNIFTEKDLVHLWKAEGFIQHSGEHNQTGYIGRKYFQELVSRSLFQQWNDQTSEYVMHDLIHDLARWAAGATCFRLEDDLDSFKENRSIEKARHSSYNRDDLDGVKKFEAFNKAKCLRTFLPLSMDYVPGTDDMNFISNHVLLNLLPKLKTLRVLSLEGYHITELPDSIGDLKHLRYLNLSSTKIRYLPESICLLFNLHSLILRYCSCLRKLPSKMQNLVNLQNLDVSNADLLEGMPVGLKELKSLQTLSNFILEKGNGSRISELANFVRLRGKLCVSNLQNVTDDCDAREVSLNKKQDLDALELKWTSVFDESREAANEEAVLNMLKPHQNLKDLAIRNYAGIRFASWLGDRSYSNITGLCLENCENCVSLPSLGQLSNLKSLEVKRLIKVQEIRAEFCGNNLLLETLRFEDMPECRHWDASQENVVRLPNLSKISILECPKLSGEFPEHLPSLKQLSVNDCKSLVVSISEAPKHSELMIDGCKEVVSKSETDLSSLYAVIFSRISNPGSLTKSLLPRMTELKTLAIVDSSANVICFRNRLQHCETVEKVPTSLFGFMCLEELHIYRCSSLICIPSTILASTVHKLDIRDCQNLQKLVADNNWCSSSTSLMKSLKIKDCPSLGCLSSRGVLPVSLTHLKVADCQQLKFIVETLQDNIALESIAIKRCQILQSLPKGLHKLSHLNKIQIEDCPSLTSLSEEGLRTSTLTELYVKGCRSLKDLEPNCLRNLTSLQYLRIVSCPGTVFAPDQSFLNNLTWLEVSESNICRPLFGWGLQRLNLLKTVWIGKGCPEIEKLQMKLPSSLTELVIQDFPNLKYLSSNCFSNLHSLGKMSFISCPKLKYFPKDGLPPSLLLLYLDECPLLAKRCKRNKGKYWSLIADIPLVVIDDMYVYDPEDQ